MTPKVSIIMGSTSDWPVMQEAAKILDQFKIPFEVNALSAHRVPEQVAEFGKTASARGIKVIIAGAGGAAHLPGVIAAFTTCPVIGVPCKSTISLDGWDSLLSIVQMPPGVPVACVAVGKAGAKNAAHLALQIIGLGDASVQKKITAMRDKNKQATIERNQKLAAGN